LSFPNGFYAVNNLEQVKTVLKIKSSTFKEK
jgi:hypothetical protein